MDGFSKEHLQNLSVLCAYGLPLLMKHLNADSLLKQLFVCPCGRYVL